MHDAMKMILGEDGWPCHWDEDLKCDHEFLCNECQHQPAPEDKPNGKAEPVMIEWSEDYDGGLYPKCPACGCQLLLSRRCRDVEDDYYNVERVPLAAVFANDEPLAAAEDVLGAEE